MSQEQQHREPLKYGDVFPNVSGEVASKPIAPRDAAAAEAAEHLVMGKVQRGGVAAKMQSAATFNVKEGILRPEDDNFDKVEGVPMSEAYVDGKRIVSEPVRGTRDGVMISEQIVDGKRIIMEAVAGQVLGQYVEPAPVKLTSPTGSLDQDAITIGQALQSAAVSAGDKAVDQCDAAAIEVAEARAIGTGEIVPGGVASRAQAAAAHNSLSQEKIKLYDVLKEAKDNLPADKPVTVQDAEAVIGAELRNNPRMATVAGGVAESIAEAARLNQNK